ncbi:hypothetical protein Dsin_001167 [Dipteronia sinensis]|uniref:RNase H type-1 domain-containing protein n=1 Tax=Dipteronia sinensis TaxID=43782 RepID=A0AAE0B3B8_9ROSI|nr:hypothetical protein Dsin_001167 [Dipteronia sinensis]
MEVSCPIYDKHLETTMDALWTCLALKGIRAMCSFLEGFCVKDSIQFFYLIVLCQNNLLTEEFELLGLVLWRVWFRRNRVTYDSSFFTDNGVVPWAISFLAKFKRANDVNKGVENGIVGIGINIRDCSGSVLASSSQKVIVVFTLQIAEAVALLRGLRMGNDIGMWPCDVVLDAHVIIDLLNSPVLTCSEVGLILHDKR